jgi:hypothetical protein
MAFNLFEAEARSVDDTWITRIWFQREQHPSYEEGRTQVLIVSPTSMSTKKGKQSVAKVAQRHHIALSASASYASSASCTRGSRAQQTSCVIGQASESGPHDFPHESAFPALGTTNVGAFDKSAAGLQQQNTMATRELWRHCACVLVERAA